MHDVMSHGAPLCAFECGAHSVAVTRVFKPGPRTIVARCVVAGAASNAMEAAAAALRQVVSPDAPAPDAPAAAVHAAAASGQSARGERAERREAQKSSAAPAPTTPQSAPAPEPVPALTLAEAVKSQQPLILKFAENPVHTVDIKKERENLRNVVGIPHVVRAVDVGDTALDHELMLVLEDAGTPLSSMCLCDNVQRAVLDLLDRQIKPALEAMHKRDYIFFDLHAGNVVCDNVKQPTKLCLIDFESLTRIGEPLHGSPLKRLCDGDQRPTTANAAWDFERLELLKAWVERGGM